MKGSYIVYKYFIDEVNKLYHLHIKPKHISILSKNCINNKIHIGNNLQKNGWNCVLFQEECKTCKKRDQNSMDKKVYDNSNQVCDRYNLNCVIKDETNNIIFNTRYNDFPWK